MFRHTRRPSNATILECWYDSTYTAIVKHTGPHITYTIYMWPNWPHKAPPLTETEWKLDTDDVSEVVTWLNRLYADYIECQMNRDPHARGVTKTFYRLEYKEL